ncbi:MAG: hypothetical protein AUJ34_00705 [Parcubacteria group bacterium CG1_02_41_12]|nr:MAG: hypothetical protein AUJ34_00705 [Parcubacteria group bacterium CG1_02_41_12]
MAPPLILYTAGFRYDFEYKRIVETGSLVVKSNPEGANIYINNQLHTEPTPTIINTILPDKINLLIQKDAYHSWEKTIEIKPRVTSFEENVTLYAESEPVPIIQTTITEYWFNEKQDKIAYITKDNQLRLFNALNQKDTLIANVDSKPLQSVIWSTNSDQFVFGRGAKEKIEYFIVDANALDRITALSNITTLPLERVEWDPRARNSLYAISRGNLYRIPFLLKTARLIFSGSIEQYLVQEKRITLIQKSEKGEYSLSWITPKDVNTVHLVPFENLNNNSVIIETHSNRIAILDSKTNELSIVDISIQDPLSEEAITEIQDVDKLIFTKDGSHLIYTDKFGIYMQNFNAPITIIPEKNNHQIIVKYSYPLREIALSEDENHVFFITDKSLRVVELNTSYAPRVTELIQDARNLKELKLNYNQKFASFIDKDNMLNGLMLDLEGQGSFFSGNE